MVSRNGKAKRQRQTAQVHGSDYEEWLGCLEHRANHAAHGSIAFPKWPAFVCVHVTTIRGEVQPRVGLTVLCVGVGEFANEVGFIASLAPCLREVGADGTGRTPHLVGECIPFLGRPLCSESEDVHGQGICETVDLEFLSGPCEGHFGGRLSVDSSQRENGRQRTVVGSQEPVVNGNGRRKRQRTVVGSRSSVVNGKTNSSQVSVDSSQRRTTR